MSSNSSSVNPPSLVSVLLPLPLDMAFDYAHSSPLPQGSLVKVSFGVRELYGIVWESSSSLSHKALKPLVKAYEEIRLPEVSLKFIDWVSDYTMAHKGQILKMALPAPDAFEGKGESLYSLVKAPKKITPKRQIILDLFETCPDPLPLNEISEKTDVSESILKALVKEGVLKFSGERPWTSPPPQQVHPLTKPHLTLDQMVAAEDIKKSLESKSFHTILLEGVTGSGKTEVYFDAIDWVLKTGGQALVMLPEIALSAQWLKRFETRFGFPPDIWHSDLTKGQRKSTFRSILNGEARVIVGARSSLFLPYPDLKLIIVDEEHDGSYKQDEGVIYNARDMAVVRARFSSATCVLASATPSLETEINVSSGKYRHIHLSDRYGGAVMPDVKLIDMRSIKMAPQEWLSPQLRLSIQATVDQGEQIMLFLNRRGYAPITLCRNCGDSLMCPHCSVSLVHHKFRDTLMCHHCGYTMHQPKKCPVCAEEGSYSPIGPGVERILEEVKTFLPGARCAVMTSDHLTTSHKISEFVEAIQNHEVDILIGTQIMAKGHHFPLLTLVGIVDGDSALSGSDLRASEKSFQLLHQVAGRSGRETKPGQVLLQTHNPDHPVMQALVQQDRAQFFALESDQRMLHGFPPYGRLAALILSGKKADEVEKAARLLAKRFPLTDKAELLGPTPAPLAFLRGNHRWRLLLKTAKDFPPHPLLKVWLSNAKLPSSIRVQIDIDPYSFF